MLAKSKNLPFETVLFDLDGTLLDTAPDLISACQHTLRQFNFKAPEAEVILTRVTSGMREMLKLGVPQEQWASAGIETVMREAFAAYYLSHICVHTTPFPGISDLVLRLHEAGIKTAVVTNKYEKMARQLFENFEFARYFTVILGCDSLTHAKPHPEPLLKAMELMAAEPQRTLYVGDHLNDIKAARAAGCPSCVALWGYGGQECGDPESWQAEYAAKTPPDLLTICKLN